MLRITAEPVDSEVSRMLLSEYFDARAASFPSRTYTRSSPDAAMFTAFGFPTARDTVIGFLMFQKVAVVF